MQGDRADSADHPTTPAGDRGLSTGSPAGPIERVSVARWQAVVAGLVIAAALVAVYARTINNEFCTLDDTVLIVDNPQMRDDGTWSRLADNVAYFWRFPRGGLASPINHMHGMYMPCTYSLWTVLLDFSRPLTSTGQIGQASPELFHLASLALHVANACLVAWLLQRLVGGFWPALAGALVFALHPAQVEAVAWISETKGVLSAFFGLSAMAVYLGPRKADPCPPHPALSPQGEAGWEPKDRQRDVAKAASGPAAPCSRGWGRYLFATVLFALALLAKPAAAAVPLLLILMGWGWWRQRLLPTVGPMLPWIGLAVGMAVLTKTQQPSSALDYVPPLWRRPLVALDTWAWYLRHLAWPDPLAIDYGRTPQFIFADGRAWWAWLVPLALVPVLWFLPGRRTWLVALAWFAVVILPISGLVPFAFQYYSSVADRYSYLALIGPALALAWALDRWPRPWLAAGAGAIIVACGLASFRQTAVWESNVRLFEHALAVNPRSWLAEFRLATLYESRRNAELAETHYRRLFLIKPDMAVAHCNLGNVLRSEGRDDEAVVEYRLAVAAMPEQWRLHLQLGLVLLDLGQVPQATESFRQVTRLRPQRFEGYHNLGLALLRAEDFSGATAALEQARELAPDRSEPIYYLGLAYAGAGDYRRGISLLRQATRRGESSVRLAGDLAWITATHAEDRYRQPEEAEKLARRACLATDFREPRLLDVLAAACAALGRYDEAEKLAGQAQDLATAAGDETLAGQIAARQEVYRRREPWREPSPRGRPWPLVRPRAQSPGEPPRPGQRTSSGAT